MALKFLMVFLMEVIEILNVVSIDFMVALAPAVITINGSTFHPNELISSGRGSYLFILCVVVSGANRSLQYVNSINCIVMVGSGIIGGGWLCSTL